MRFGSDFFCRVFGEELLDFKQGEFYRDHFICPLIKKNSTNFRCAIFSPAGDFETLFEPRREPSPDYIFDSIETVIVAGKIFVDARLAYWSVSEMIDRFEETGVINKETSYKFSIALEKWHEEEVSKSVKNALNLLEAIELKSA